MPKFDVVIGNPPYDGKGNPLYLQILESILPNCKKCSWICPSQWTVNIEDSKYIEDLKNGIAKTLIYYQDLGNPFNDATLGNSIYLYVFDNTCDSLCYENYETIRNEKYTNKKLALSIINKFKNHDNLNNHADSNSSKSKYNDRYCVNAGYVRGNIDKTTSKPKWDWTTLFSDNYRTKYEYVYIQNGHHWYFNSIEECINFINACETDIIAFGMLISKITTNNTGIVLKYMPWLSDYTHEWTEEMIIKELDLTIEEVDYIHQEMKNFGWKTKSK